MFGIKGRQRERNRKYKTFNDFKNIEKNKQRKHLKSVEEKEQKNRMITQNTAAEEARKMAEERTQGRSEGRKYAEELFGRDVQGMSPQEKMARQGTAHHNIDRQLQGYQREMLAKQSRGNIRGGAAFAQQADLARLGAESKNQYARDLEQADQDMRLKKLAAMFNIEQGEGAQRGLDRRLALDEANLDVERKRQRLLEDEYRRNFQRI